MSRLFQVKHMGEQKNTGLKIAIGIVSILLIITTSTTVYFYTTNEVNSLKIERDNLKQQVDNLITERDSRLSPEQSDILITEREALKQQVNELITERDSLRSELESRISSLESQINSLQSDNYDLETQLSNLQTEKSNLENEVRSLEDQIFLLRTPEASLSVVSFVNYEAKVQGSIVNPTSLPAYNVSITLDFSITWWRTATPIGDASQSRTLIIGNMDGYEEININEMYTFSQPYSGSYVFNELNYTVNWSETE